MSSDCLLTAAERQKWRDEGAVVVQLPESIWKSACKEVHHAYPQERPANWKDDFGSPDGKFAFPTAKLINGKVSEYRALDDLVLNEELIKIAQTLLSTDDISLTQADAWCKYGSGHGQGSGFGGDESLGNKDQRIHMDYGVVLQKRHDL